MTTLSDPAVASLIAFAVIGVFALFSVGTRLFPRHDLTAGERFNAVDGRLDRLEHRVGGVEAHVLVVEEDGKKTKHDVANIRMALRTMPTVKDVAELRAEVGQLAGKVDGNGQVLQLMSASVGRIEDFLLKATADRIAAGRMNEGER